MIRQDRHTLLRLYLWMALAFFALTLLASFSRYPGQFALLVINSLWRMAYIVPVNFLFFEFAVPYVLRRRRFLLFNLLTGLFCLLGFALLWSVGSFAWRLIGLGMGVYTEVVTYPSLDLALQNAMAHSMGAVVFFGIIRHAYRYTRLKHDAQQLRIEKQEAELNFLRSQTNPHFLFNTLNNIYSLTRDKSDRAPEAVLRLSKMLRYMLYETGGEFVAIEQELHILSDYLELEKLRYDDSLRVVFHHDVDDLRQALPPLLLMPLVENAFKHGASETRGEAFVDVRLSVHAKQLLFVVKNSSEVLPGAQAKENIGLRNLRRQLLLLYTDYSLALQPETDTFTAVLKINLASHV